MYDKNAFLKRHKEKSWIIIKISEKIIFKLKQFTENGISNDNKVINSSRRYNSHKPIFTNQKVPEVLSSNCQNTREK